MKKVPESKRALATNQAQAPVCLQRPFAMTGLLFIILEPDAVTFLDAVLKVLCAVLAEGFWQVQTRGKESYELLNDIMQGSGSPPEML